MGWASGSGIMIGIIAAAKNRMPDLVRLAFYQDVIRSFEGEDWDTQEECIGEDPMYDEALKRMHPEWYGDER